MSRVMKARKVESDSRWAAVVRRDPAATFYYSVETTGVYCRPSCGARLPRPENVSFHASPQDAERRGFRACKRCKPDAAPRAERDAELVTELCRLIEGSERVPSLRELAAHAGLSPSHTHRIFKAATGLSPKSYARGHRAQRLRDELPGSSTVTEAIFETGYGSSGRFYEESSAVLGMTPKRYREGARGMRIRFAVGQCSLGAVLVAATQHGVCAILMGDEPGALVHDLERRFEGAQLVGADEEFEQVVAQVVGLVEQPGLGAELPLDIRGTAFQQRVWDALRKIPAGRTMSYAELARAIGSPRSVRAVATACGANPLAVAIPCHRVVRKDGDPAGYRWGVERKVELLARERQG